MGQNIRFVQDNLTFLYKYSFQFNDNSVVHFRFVKLLIPSLG